MDLVKSYSKMRCDVGVLEYTLQCCEHLVGPSGATGTFVVGCNEYVGGELNVNDTTILNNNLLFTNNIDISLIAEDPIIPLAVENPRYVSGHSFKTSRELGYTGTFLERLTDPSNVQLRQQFASRSIGGLTGSDFGSVAIGYDASINGQGEHAIAIGSYAGGSNPNTREFGGDTGIGYQDYADIAIGPYAAYNGQYGDNVAVGNFSAGGGQGILNTSVGPYNLVNGPQYVSNVAVGTTICAESYQGSFNVAMGSYVCGETGTGQDEYNIGIGSGVGQFGGQAYSNIAIGTETTSYGQFEDNIAIGSFAAYGLGNTGIGYGQYQSNIAIGDNAAYFGQNFYNIALGYEAGYAGQTGSASIAIGQAAGSLGQYDRCIALGYGAQGAGTGTYQPNDSIAIGTNATVLGSSSIAIGSNVYAQSNAIVINANNATSLGGVGGLFVNPILSRGSAVGALPLYYDVTTKEIFYFND